MRFSSQAMKISRIALRNSMAILNVVLFVVLMCVLFAAGACMCKLQSGMKFLTAKYKFDIIIKNLTNFNFSLTYVKLLKDNLQRNPQEL